MAVPRPPAPVLREVAVLPLPVAAKSRQLTPAVALLAITAIGLLLRLYRLEVVGWMPDNYERLADAARLAHGHLPQSRIYPPGITWLLAPLMVFFPATLVTAQCLIIAAGTGLIAFGYIHLNRLSRQSMAALFFAFMLATSGPFVGATRDSHYDILVTLLVAVTLFLVPLLRGRALAAFVAYGALLAVLVNIRSTNVFLLPIVFLYWLDPMRPGWSIRLGLKTILSPQLLVTLATVALITGVSIATGRWFGNTASSPFTTSSYVHNVIYYAGVITGGPVLIFTLPLAVAGARRLWRSEPSLTVSVLLLLVTWPLVHSPFLFNSTRYMLPASYFYLLLVALGPEALWQWRPTSLPLLAKLVRPYATVAVAAIAIFFAALSLFIVHKWPVIAAQADSVLYRQVNPAIGGLPEHALVISAVARGFPPSGGAEYVDLIDESLDSGGVTPAAIDEIVAMAEGALNEGRPVYYLYSRWEAGVDFEGEGREGYQRYFDAIGTRFNLREAFHTTAAVPEEKPWLQYPWVLYEVTRK